ncbi:MAG: glutamate ligase domain-containing protein, partial [Armatimonadota bacterium]
ATVRSPWGSAPILVPSPARLNVVNALFAIAAGGACGVAPEVSAHSLLRFEAPAGRLRTIPLANGGSCIDDCYNAAPDSMEGALGVLAAAEVGAAGKRVAVLGEMQELGAFAGEGHSQVGRAVARLCPDMLVLIGDATRSIESAARVDGYPADRIHWFATSGEVAQLLPAVLSGSDIVLVKGSRAAGLESVVAAVEARLGVSR